MSKNQPLVSVIVLCFNHSRFIRKCLDSIIEQNYSNLEIIIADDCSSDDTVKTIIDFIGDKDLEAKTIFNQTNQGKNFTLNECLKHVTGKYLALIAGDDYFLSNKLNYQVQELESHGDEFGMIYGDFIIIDENDKIISQSKFEMKYGFKNNMPQGSIFNDVLTDHFIWIQTALIRFDVMKLNLFKFDLKIISEDWHLALFISRYSKIVSSNQTFAAYRILPSSFTRANFIGDKLNNVYLSHIYMFKCFLLHPKNTFEDDKCIKHKITQFYSRLIGNKYSNSYKKIIYLFKAILYFNSLFDFFSFFKKVMGIYIYSILYKLKLLKPLLKSDL